MAGLQTKAEKNFVDISVILNDGHEKNKLQIFIDEVIKCKQEILNQNESIKSIRDAAMTALNIDPKLFNSLVSLMFNHNWMDKKKEIEQLDMAITGLMQADDSDE